MALIKEIKGKDGVTTSYHVVSYISSNPNASTIVSITSYIDEASANEAMAGSIAPYRTSDTYTFPFSEGMTVARAYEHLLTLAKFEGAEVTEEFPEDVTGDEFISMLEEVM